MGMKQRKPIRFIAEETKRYSEKRDFWNIRTTVFAFQKSKFTSFLIPVKFHIKLKLLIISILNNKLTF